MNIEEVSPLKPHKLYRGKNVDCTNVQINKKGQQWVCLLKKTNVLVGMMGSNPIYGKGEMVTLVQDKKKTRKTLLEFVGRCQKKGSRNDHQLCLVEHNLVFAHLFANE